MKAANFIGLADVMRIMRRGEPCDIMVAEYSESRQTGGGRNTYNKVILVQSTAKSMAENANKSTENVNELAQKRNPHHLANGTINIQLQNGAIEKIRPCLIEKFNGQKVAL